MSYVLSQSDISAKNPPIVRGLYGYLPDLTSYVLAQPDISAKYLPEKHVSSTYPDLMSYVLYQPNVSASKISIEPYMHSDLSGYVADLPLSSAPRIEPRSF